MKRTILITTVILCLIVFITTFIAGTVLTVTTIGWNQLLDSNSYRIPVDQFIERIQNWSGRINIGPLSNYLIDETKTDNLDGIETIIISAVSENIRVSDDGTTLSANMKGSYRSSKPLVWNVTRTGQTLQIKAEFPSWGFRSSDLVIDVQIPKSYKGKIEIRSVSGNCILANRADTSWSSVTFTGVSGSLTADKADWSKVEANTVSGTISLASLAGKAILKSISGSIDAAFKGIEPKDVKIDTVSGKVVLRFSEKAKFNISFDTVSGTLDSSQLPLQTVSQVKRNFDGTRNGGGNSIAVKSISGSLTLSPAA